MVCVLTLAASAGGLAVLLIVRLWAVLRSHPVTPRQSLGLLIVAGSGGHTAEILRLVGSLSGAYSPRHYVIAESDEMSAKKIHSLELARAQNDSTTEVCDHFSHRVLPSPNSEKPGGSAVLALLRVHYLVLHMVFLPTGSPNKARLGPLEISAVCSVQRSMCYGLNTHQWAEFPGG
ncbi:UDP-N-acetylglucosamine transferase subunit ALG14 homolog isoform X3 [Rattus norvegicus]|uniref:UDP-N-acetylglucosamine transferase subunit ALG14 homolog isoform X3 n=1 Tax=Rattus norvegicus TaxID=10116 RepID=UPI0003D0849F|nr:UDP-N-acetylglucosamine transferase subunit ALG14 homolog isoform X3 [Rattus norvegicus]XP_017446467.1 UDP-N-acetylglucosamine transferase subunit ALG14 homolog isoform X3 [Rattus norvegicus]|eukprot:XP_006233305.1 PREDICTED: UDP-N-acetylglucosamine transferase subunit ALG14 homolog isoform X3 [Rattus norvegicus]